MNYHQSFAPVVFKDSQLLILGSMPGKVSLLASQYYAHPQNLFWKIISEITGFDCPKDWTDKVNLLQCHKIALWDVCKECEREGSLDSAIKNEVPNEINGLLSEYTGIKIIAFNGKKTQQLYDRYFSREESMIYKLLPSSSPANASQNYQYKLSEWESVIKYGCSI